MLTFIKRTQFIAERASMGFSWAARQVGRPPAAGLTRTAIPTPPLELLIGVHALPRSPKHPCQTDDIGQVLRDR